MTMSRSDKDQIVEQFERVGRLPRESVVDPWVVSTVFGFVPDSLSTFQAVLQCKSYSFS